MVQVSSTTTIPRCDRCGRRHRSWRALACCRWPRSWAIGEGRFATVAYCGWSCSIELHPSLEEAERAKADLDLTGCGGRCGNHHQVIDLSKPRRENRY